MYIAVNLATIVNSVSLRSLQHTVVACSTTVRIIIIIVNFKPRIMTHIKASIQESYHIRYGEYVLGYISC